MPTTKKRLNITLSGELEEMLELLSQRDDVSQATKAVELLKQAIETEEDEMFHTLAEKRNTKTSTFLSHKEAWK